MLAKFWLQLLELRMIHKEHVKINIVWGEGLLEISNAILL